MAAVTRTFAYEVVDNRGKRSRGKVDAANEVAAAALLRQQGSVPLSISSTDSVLRKEIRIPGLGGRVTLKDLAVFARQFATLTSSGMSLLRSLAVLEEQSAKPRLRKAVADVREEP